MKSNISKYFKLSRNLGRRTCWGNTVQQVQSFVKLISDVADLFSCIKLPPYTCQAKSFGRWTSPGAPRKEMATGENRLRVAGDCLGQWWDTQVWIEMYSSLMVNEMELSPLVGPGDNFCVAELVAS